MNKDFEIQVEVAGEYGYELALEGLSYNMDSPLEDMPALAEKLCHKDGGHNKFLEQIHLWIRVRAPRYIWQEMDTYRISTKSSQSTMHTILKNELTPLNFENEDVEGINLEYLNNLLHLGELVLLKKKLPEGFMQKRMWQMSYKTMRNIIIQRLHHRMPHWKSFIYTIINQVQHRELLPYSE